MKPLVVKRKRKIRFKLWFALVLILAAYPAWALTRPILPLSPQLAQVSLKIETPPSVISWPTEGQSAVGVVGTDIVETHGPQTPVPTASTAKIITTLVVLKQKPLQLNESGPSITITPDDVTRYKTYVSKDGSVLPVQAGEKLSEYQMLQALLLPSANNIADTLAIWAYGSLDNYAKEANAYLASQGLTGSHVGSDASGLDAETKSNAGDLVKLGKLAMQNQVVAQIVGQSSAPGFPIAGTIKNVNSLLGSHNIVGIKTGNSDEAGGAFVSAATVTVGGKPQTVISAVMSAPTLFAAMKSSLPLIDTAQTNIQPVTAVKAGQVVGKYDLPWGGSIDAVVNQDLTTTAWNGTPLSAKVILNKTKPKPLAGEEVGKITTNQTTTSVVLKSGVPKPPLQWRLTHPSQ